MVMALAVLQELFRGRMVHAPDVRLPDVRVVAFCTHHCVRRSVRRRVRRRVCFGVVVGPAVVHELLRGSMGHALQVRLAVVRVQMLVVVSMYLCFSVRSSRWRRKRRVCVRRPCG